MKNWANYLVVDTLGELFSSRNIFSKHVKSKYSTSLEIQEMPIKTTSRIYVTLMRMACSCDFV